MTQSELNETEKKCRTFGIKRKDCNQEQIEGKARTDVYSTTHSDSRHQRACELIYDLDILMSRNQIQSILVGMKRSRPISPSRNVIIFRNVSGWHCLLEFRLCYVFISGHEGHWKAPHALTTLICLRRRKRILAAWRVGGNERGWRESMREGNERMYR